MSSRHTRQTPCRTSIREGTPRLARHPLLRPHVPCKHQPTLGWTAHASVYHFQSLPASSFDHSGGKGLSPRTAPCQRRSNLGTLCVISASCSTPHTLAGADLPRSAHWERGPASSLLARLPGQRSPPSRPRTRRAQIALRTSSETAFPFVWDSRPLRYEAPAEWPRLSAPIDRGRIFCPSFLDSRSGSVRDS